MPIPSPTYPFGRPVATLPPDGEGLRDALILSAVPGALLVRWTPPGGRTVRALPVADEPRRLWDGHDAAAHVAAWQQAVAWEPGWGTVGPSPDAGAAGRWLEQRVLAPLHLRREQVRVETCIEGYRATPAVVHRISDAYLPAVGRLGLPAAALPPLAGDAALLREILATRVERLDERISDTMPALVVTLGGIAYRIAAALLGGPLHPLPRRLPADAAGYGRGLAGAHRGRPVRLLPLAHPASPRPLQILHEAWMARLASQAAAGMA